MFKKIHNIKEKIYVKMSKKELISLTISKIERKFGKGSIMRLGSNSIFKNSYIISSGSICLNIILGIGGYPLGRIIEIYGPESGGKTTLGLHAIAEIQKINGTAVFIDVEHALDINYAKNLGIILEDLLIAQPDNGEQALEIINILSVSNIINLIVVDSVAALVPKNEIEGDFQDIQIGTQARLMSKALRKITGFISNGITSIIFINQIRIKIGTLFGNPETTSGGNALKFYSSIRIEIRRINNIKKGNEIIGNRTKVKVIKNKLASPFREIEFDILYGLGISKEGELIDLGIKSSIIKKNGVWFNFNNKPLGQGKEHLRQNMINNYDLTREIQSKIFNTVVCKIEKRKMNKIKNIG